RSAAVGETGPLRQGPGYAARASAVGGTWYVNGPADRPPARPTPVYPDYMTGLFTAFGVMAALRHRDATGQGQWIDAALYESAFRVMEFTATLYGRQGIVRERGGLPRAPDDHRRARRRARRAATTRRRAEALADPRTRHARRRGPRKPHRRDPLAAARHERRRDRRAARRLRRLAALPAPRARSSSH